MATKKEKPPDTLFVCEGCGEVLNAVVLAANGAKICTECGGRALSVQEAGDRILELKQELREIKEYYEGGGGYE